MAHQILENDQMFYLKNQVPWHGLGKEFKEDRPATSQEALIYANLGWKVNKRPLVLARNGKTVDGHFEVYREDTDYTLGIVGKSYTELQQAEAFSFFDAIVGDNQAIFHTAGSLFNGKVVWILAKLPGDIKVSNDDCIEKYLLLTTSHDGSKAVQVMFTPTRVVCSNTLNIALREGGNKVSIRHTSSVVENLKQAHKLMGITSKFYEEMGNVFNIFTKKAMNSKLLDQYIDAVFKPEVKEDEEEKEVNEYTRNTVIQLFESGKGNKGETLWDAFNGMTEFVDHHRKRGAKEVEKRFNSLIFGNGQQVKQKAYDEAFKLAA